ncbi:unnamed protein product [Hermetia illucens]|uniref:rhomboid protease n=1 Tax=Hermetia illucens TaxID=343691 RepID=A0A7R8YLE0_HERIL|nr:presenilins-associated rhomboid-like protein, mitochondrial [Hermetia illucens]CAD7077445.1 unnamed protein product [Hermetia illucens]
MFCFSQVNRGLGSQFLQNLVKISHIPDGVGTIARSRTWDSMQVYSNFVQCTRRSFIREATRSAQRRQAFRGTLLQGGESPHVPPSRLLKPFIFTVAFGTGSFLAVSVWEYETARGRAKNALKSFSGIPWFKSRVHDKRNKGLLQNVREWWNTLSPGERVFVPICAINLAIFGLWKVPQLNSFMMRYFCSNPAARAVCWPMVLSTFSHYSFLHLLANMYVLHSFIGAAVNAVGREQFLGLYLSAGVLSSFTSYAYKVLTKQMGPSLGASGAIMAVLALVCVAYPHTELSILFLPQFTFSAGSAIKAIMAIDLAGCLFKWKFFDHAAHLGGALFGLFWCQYGIEHLWPKREHFLRYWHQWRSR